MLGRTIIMLTAVAVVTALHSTGQGNTVDGPVSYAVTKDVSSTPGKLFEVNVSFFIQKGWYIYAPTGVNAVQGKIEINTVFTPPQGISRIGRIKLPKPTNKGGQDVYDADTVTMSQVFKLSESIHAGRYEIKVKVTYQTCNDVICLPPLTTEIETYVHVDGEDDLRAKKNAEYMDLRFRALDGREVDLSSLSGKVVLIDCWATWCEPCLKELPHLKSLYERYREKGFEVIGVSLDESSSKERVLQVIEKHAILWPQRFEGKGFKDDSFAKRYDIKSLPELFLVNRGGKIIARQIYSEDLETLIHQLLQ